jgi:hypothetical protein
MNSDFLQILGSFAWFGQQLAEKLQNINLTGLSFQKRGIAKHASDRG